MGKRGIIQYKLTGSYTRNGYHSFIPDLIKGLDQVWLLKGPVGSGKAIFIRNLGENLADQGYEVEFWLSAIEPGSAEGVFIPQLKAAVINSTLPGPIDQPLPADTVHIVNFGEGFDEEALKGLDEELTAIAAQMLHHHRLAENLIENALCLDDCIIEENAKSISQARLSRLIGDLSEAIFSFPPGEKHYYAGSLTIDGFMDYINEISRTCYTRFIMQGPVGSGQDEIFRQLAFAAQTKGLKVEYYHWGLDPARTSIMVIPSLKVGILDGSYISPIPQAGDVLIDLGTVQDLSTLVLSTSGQASLEKLMIQVQVELDEVYRAFRQLKKVQARAMDQEWLDKKREEIERKIVQR